MSKKKKKFLILVRKTSEVKQIFEIFVKCKFIIVIRLIFLNIFWFNILLEVFKDILIIGVFNIQINKLIYLIFWK